MVVCMVGSLAGTIAVVMAFSLGRVGGERWCGGWLWRALVPDDGGAPTRIWSSGLTTLALETSLRDTVELPS